MSKTITSPIARWSGEVILISPLTYPQLIAWDDGYQVARPYTAPMADGSTDRYVVDRIRYNYAMLAGTLACVESHTLKDLPAKLTADNFPATPFEEAMELAKWLIGEVADLLNKGHDPKDASE